MKRPSGRTAAAARSEKYGKEAVCTTSKLAAVAKEVDQHPHAEYERGQDTAPPARVELEARAHRYNSHSWHLGALEAVPLAEGQVRHPVPVGRQALAELAVPPLGTTDREGKQAVIDEAHTHGRHERDTSERAGRPQWRL